MKKIIGITVFVFLLFFAVSCQKQEQAQVEKQDNEQKTEEYCAKTGSDKKMSYDDAKAIAEKSDCVKEGGLKETHMCNENSGTWWIDLDVDKKGCSPACVIDTESGSAEINWRCTGLLPE
ncbi:hypothetical protein KKH43_02920 [Patescibacteria group bacterium]|nr:hypothetical protein [Patescibacteria group bacterium]